MSRQELSQFLCWWWRYSGKISESIKKILKNRLKTKNYKDSDIEETANSYNFIGNDRKLSMF